MTFTDKILNKKYKLIIATIITALFLINFISAFAVSSPYMGEEKQLNMYPGQEKDLEFSLQNEAGDPIQIGASISEGNEIAKISDDKTIYTIPAGIQVKVNVKLSIPDNAPLGSKYPVKLSFSTATSGETGEFAFGSSIEQDFNVVIGKEEVKTPGTANQTSKIIYMVIGVLVIAAILITIFLVRRYKRTTPVKSKRI